MSLNERLRFAMLEAGMTQKQLADAVRVKPPSVHGWLSSKAKFLRGENLLKAAQALNVSEKWLATGTGPMRAVTANSNQETPSKQDSNRTKLDACELRVIESDDELDPETDVLLDEIDVMLAAGNGILIPEFVETQFKMPFPISWLRDVHINSKDVKLMRVHGDSMERTLFNKDRVMVNFADTYVRDGKVYAIAIDGEAKVKRLYTLRNNGLRIASDNHARDSEGHRIHEDRTISPKEIGTVQVIGRVIGKIGDGGL
ncbi:helix-turn-helix transcriptional regulator [Xylella fastidiosa]|uniref:LexA family transcriptional regulator n=1 Tax=Xylella fastidiosa TaxID=2371 RepID=UPI0003D33CAC|nr:helix-turn-helix transcriptional regulator [Xylella fastidiosa]ALR04355.1 helix-turn-helix transcriptional regulator [Xylella fastidiosa]ALR04407.1 helix-turn-helix transcriptional regulator [Xylella fastidiosa]KXB18678.1 peptidase S24 [Xylella fastidiosa]OJZ70712.1 peptidase S24 [Xylella fastidiosa 6c]